MSRKRGSIQATRVVTAGAYSNIATVTGNDPNSTLVTATDTSAHTGVNIALETPVPRQLRLNVIPATSPRHVHTAHTGT